MKRHVPLFLVAVIAWCAGHPAKAQEPAAPGKTNTPGAAREAAGKDEAEVLGETKKYIGLLKSAQPAQAMEAYWDFDAMLTGIFGKDLEKHSREEREEMKKLLIDLVRGTYDDPRVAEAMRDATVQNLQAEPQKEGLTVVNFDVIIGDATLPNVLHFRKKGNAWRVVDGGVNGQLLVPSLRTGFNSLRGTVTPLQFVREVAKPRGREEQKKEDRG